MWKFANDNTISEVILKDKESTLQETMNQVVEWWSSLSSCNLKQPSLDVQPCLSIIYSSFGISLLQTSKMQTSSKQSYRKCDNPTCSDQNNSESQLTYNLLVDISDHSGTLTNCRIMSSPLETVLGYPVSSFESSLYNC